MTKLKFLMALNEKLSDMPQNEVEERLVFYSEMIEDRMEEGLSEEEAVAAVGSVEEIAAQISSESPDRKKKQKTKERKIWRTVLLCLGSPIWLSLLIAAFAVVLALYISLWAVVISLWAAFAAVTACIFGSAVAGIGFICGGNVFEGLALIGVCFVCAGLSIFLFYGCKAATKGSLWLGKKLCLWIKKCFSGKEDRK